MVRASGLGPAPGLGPGLRRRILEPLHDGPTPVGQLAAAAKLATQDDASVAGGLLTVTVRHWQPIMLADAWA